jgi:hypothetical protein
MDVSVTLTSGFAAEMASLHANAPRSLTTPELMPPPPTYNTPQNFFRRIMPSPDTVGTVMPDTPGMGHYDGPTQLPQKPVFPEQSAYADENNDKRAKRTRHHSIMPNGITALFPITENINEQSETVPLTKLDKDLWREPWEAAGRPGSFEDFARQQKVAMLHGDLEERNSKSSVRFYFGLSR